MRIAHILDNIEGNLDSIEELLDNLEENNVDVTLFRKKLGEIWNELSDLDEKTSRS